MKTILENIYKEKKLIRKKYSLRSFSKEMGINVATLSRVMSGKSTLSVNQAEKLLLNDNIDTKTKSKIISIYFPSSAKQPQFFSGKQIDLTRQKLNQKQKVIRFNFNWIDLALLDLFSISEIEQDIAVLAKILSTTTSKICDSIEKLESNDLISLTPNGYIKKEKNIYLTASDEESLINVRKFHKELAHRGLEELNITNKKNIESRLINSYIISTSESKIAEAKKKIEKFQKSLIAFMTDVDATELYALSSIFFPLTKSEKILSSRIDNKSTKSSLEAS